MMEFAWTTSADTLPDLPGAYALKIDIDKPARLPSHRFTGFLAPGHYCYVGSAHGPGGIRARCARHLRQDKRKHWHVDWLTGVAVGLAASPHSGETECGLLTRLLATGRVSIPVLGFGSSDCRSCPSHLVRVEGPDL